MNDQEGVRSFGVGYEMLTGAFRVLVGYGRVLVEQLQALLEAYVLLFSSAHRAANLFG